MDRQSVMIGCAYLRRRPLPFAKDSEVVVLVVLIILLKQEEVAIVAEIASLFSQTKMLRQHLFVVGTVLDLFSFHRLAS